MLRLLKVRGASLWPDYREGDYVLAAGMPFPARKIRAGDVIVFRQPGYGTLIKRVRRVLANGQAYDVRGTQIASSDSRNFGPVAQDQVTGKVIASIRAKQTSQNSQGH
ncbi:MAG: S26 family signal peptidase [Brevefilum sp.]|nr:S26 family signal peptidase [Brevefilum sp.]